MLDSLAPARRRLVLGVLGLAALAVVAATLAIVVPRLSASGDDVRPVGQDAQPPVLLVPGYGGGTSGLEVMAAALRRDGRQVTVVHLAGDGTGDLHRQAAVVQQAVVGTGSPSVDVVGYSAGGVTVRLWARAYGGGSVARRIVTLGSPQHGTDLAALANDLAPGRCPAACRQLATDSDLLRELNRGDETPDGPAWVSIWTTDDAISTPPDTASLAGALDFSVQQVCPGVDVSHGELPASPIVIAMVEAQLRQTPPTVPGAGVCG
ncbi:MAG TPA: alpha/beta fold hydrolase [Nocardioides sp.]|nr:alpha/beta fold hydrolase [Nocardioides sp.]